MIGKVFKAYDVRATYPRPLSEKVAWQVGHGAAKHLLAEAKAAGRLDPMGRAVVVGRDMRTSSPSLSASLIDGLRDAGARVIDIGLVDTPAVYFAINRFDAGTRMMCSGRGITEIGRGSHELKVFVHRDPLKVFPVLRGDSRGQVGLLFEIRLVVSQEVARVVGYILKECLAGDAFVVALVAGLIGVEGPAIFRADCPAARASQSLIDTETEPTGLAGLSVVDETPRHRDKLNAA